MQHIRATKGGVIKHIKTKSRTALSIVGVTIVGAVSLAGFVPALAGASSGSTVYDNIPNHIPGNVPSVGYEATSTSEYGSQVELDGNKRKDPTVTVLMSSWACKSGTWNAKNCITNPGSTFTHPVTLNIYDVNDDDSVGSLIATKTRTFTMPYRPTADDGTYCNAANGTAGEWWDGHQCNNGKAFTVDFNMDGVTLPDDVIIAVAYNTSHHGYAPLGDKACNATPQGCPYDSLNVGTNPAPTVGTSEPDNDSAYYNTSYGPFYCDSGAGGTGTFRLDSGCWTGYLPAIQVDASGGKGNHNNHHNHRHHSYGDRDKHKKYGGFYSFWNS